MRKNSLIGLTVGAIGVVYGDLGTSPLYAINEVFFGHNHLNITNQNILGIISLVIWVISLVIALKYVLLVLKADNEKEGGVFALYGLISNLPKRKSLTILTTMLIFAAGLLIGDGIITPAISVLSAVEGLKIVTPKLESWVLPIAILILTIIFLFQRKGPKAVGKIYGPIMIAWFIALAALGSMQIFHNPQIIQALNPIYAFNFLISTNLKTLIGVIGAIFLVITGAEALYADMGHFDRKSIQLGWFFMVYPALILNYAGQGAYLLSGAEISAENIFYSLVPKTFLLPMIILATMATIIASVAIIFGVYSLIAQAMALGLSPRFKILHTNREQEGQIYAPMINWLLFAGCIILLLGLKTTSNLASAYGLAVSGVMLATSLAIIPIAINSWQWNKKIIYLIFGFFVVLDIIFFFSNSLKFFKGGYVPVFIGIILFIVMSCWQWGKKLLKIALDSFTQNKDMQWFLNLKKRVIEHGGILSDHRIRKLVEIDRATIFMISRPIQKLSDNVPAILRIYLKKLGAIPKDIIFLTIEQKNVPYTHKDRYQIIDFGMNVYTINARFGFMENPNAANMLCHFKNKDIIENKFCHCAIETGEEDLIIGRNLSVINRWRAEFFKFLLRLSIPAYYYFGFNPETEAGLSKIVIPIRINNLGIKVEIPEAPLEQKSCQIDPDTLEPTTVKFTKI